MTDCPACTRAELPPLRRLALDAGALLGTRPAQLFAGHADLIAAMLGAPVLSWYDRHRAAYVTTGDPAELARMLRHVTAPPPP